MSTGRLLTGPADICHDKKARKRISDRLVISGIFRVIKTGSDWRQLPEFYGKWTTVYSRFKRWSKVGILEKIFRIFTKGINISLKLAVLEQFLLKIPLKDTSRCPLATQEAENKAFHLE